MPSFKVHLRCTKVLNFSEVLIMFLPSDMCTLDVASDILYPINLLLCLLPGLLCAYLSPLGRVFGGVWWPSGINFFFVHYVK
jgi:hypothetical protein